MQPVKDPFETEVNVKDGDLTYGQRLELGKILSGTEDEYELFIAVIKCLYGKKPEPKDFKRTIPLFQSALEGIDFWIKAENTYLKYEPTNEEKEAGVERYLKNAGEISTVYAIAKDFGKDPDEVLNWKYGKIFGYLRKQKADADFQKSYGDVIKRKSKVK